MANINLFENLLLIFGSGILAYIFLTIFFLLTAIKAGLTLRIILLFFVVWTIFFAFYINNLIFTIVAITLIIASIVLLIFDILR